MKIISLAFLIFFLTLVSLPVNAMPTENESEKNPYKPSINIFTINTSEKASALISLSDIHPLNNDSNSIVIPNKTKHGFEAAQYTLESTYRERFLSQIGISETDSVFIYDYQHGNLVSFAVKDLNIIARLSPYTNSVNGPFSQDDYMIGFEVNQKALAGLKSNLWNVLVYVGSENPFSIEPLTPLVWHETSDQKYPVTNEHQNNIAFSDVPAYVVEYMNLPHGNTYLAETADFQYFLQDYTDNNLVVARRLLVVEPQTQEIIIDKIFYESESTSPAALNYEKGYDDIFQWTGKLFKNKPPVVFGFVWTTFGCPSISVIDQSNEDIGIHCDNRH